MQCRSFIIVCPSYWVAYRCKFYWNFYNERASIENAHRKIQNHFKKHSSSSSSKSLRDSDQLDYG